MILRYFASIFKMQCFGFYTPINPLFLERKTTFPPKKEACPYRSGGD